MMKIALTSDLHYGFSGKTDAKLRKMLRKLRKDIKEQDIKLLIVAGDSASIKQRQFKRCFEVIREFVKIPIVTVRGNHDFWCGEDDKCKETFTTLKDVYSYQEKVFKDNDIHHLDEPFKIEDVLICGFDGWYEALTPPTNDHHWMPYQSGEGHPSMMYLTHKAFKDFEKCLKVDVLSNRKSIIVTHFNVTPYKGGGYAPTRNGMNASYEFYDEMKTKFDVLCYGHTHVLSNDDDEGFKVYNSGSDYNSPKYLIFEV